MNQEDIKQKNKELLKHMLSIATPQGWEESLVLTRNSIKAISGNTRLKNIRKVLIVGQGTSYATSLNAEFFFSRLSGLSSRALTAYQLRKYMDDYMKNPAETLVIGISSGGNTVSVAESIRLAKSKGALTMCISHQYDCKIADEAELRVSADTRVEDRVNAMAYSVSHEYLLAASFFTAIMIGKINGYLKDKEANVWEERFKDMQAKMAILPQLAEQMKTLAEDFLRGSARNIVVLGTGPNFGTMKEGALKICELSWMFCAGEELEDFAHGRFREVDGNIPLFIIAPDENTYDKTMDLLAGCDIADEPAVVFTGSPSEPMKKLARKVYVMPKMEELLTPFLYVYAFWLFGYYVSDLQNMLAGDKRFGLFAKDIDYSAHFDIDGNRKL